MKNHQDMVHQVDDLGRELEISRIDQEKYKMDCLRQTAK